MPVQIEIVNDKDQSISTTNLKPGDSLSYPLVARKLFTEELLIILSSGAYKHCIRQSIGPFKSKWTGAFNPLSPGKEKAFTVPLQSRLIVKNIETWLPGSK